MVSLLRANPSHSLHFHICIHIITGKAETSREESRKKIKLCTELTSFQWWNFASVIFVNGIEAISFKSLTVAGEMAEQRSDTGAKNFSLLEGQRLFFCHSVLRLCCRVLANIVQKHSSFNRNINWMWRENCTSWTGKNMSSYQENNRTMEWMESGTAHREYSPWNGGHATAAVNRRPANVIRSTRTHIFLPTESANQEKGN